MTSQTVYTTRVLPQAEWPRLVGTELEGVWPHLDPTRGEIIVVEWEGEIVACWAKLQVIHLEGLWIAPAQRLRTSVARRLWQAMRQAVQSDGATTAVTSAIDPTVRGLIEHVGGVQLPGEHFVMRVS